MKTSAEIGAILNGSAASVDPLEVDAFIGRDRFVGPSALVDDTGRARIQLGSTTYSRDHLKVMSVAALLLIAQLELEEAELAALANPAPESPGPKLVERPAPPRRAEVVDLLKTWLVRAERGQLKSCMVAADMIAGDIGYQFTPCDDQFQFAGHLLSLALKRMGFQSSASVPFK